MSADSKRELILAYLKTAFQGISKDGGYWFDIEPDSVMRRLESLERVTDAMLPVVCIQAGPEGTLDHSSAKANMQFNILIVGYTKADDAEMVDTEIERLIRDVKKAFYADIGLGSNSHSSRIVDPRSDIGVIGMPEYGLFAMEIQTTYGHDFSAP